MAKQLRIKNVDSKFNLTAGELKGWLTANFADTTPVVLKCAGKNYRLREWCTVGTTPVLIGKRGKSDK
jgi:hypothetical protein